MTMQALYVAFKTSFKTKFCADTGCALVGWDAILLVLIALISVVAVRYLVTLIRDRTRVKQALTGLVLLGGTAIALHMRRGSDAAVVIVVVVLMFGLYLKFRSINAINEPAGGKKYGIKVTSFAVTLLLVALSISYEMTWRLCADQRQIVLEQMRERPMAHWPRGGAHAVLSSYGAGRTEKAYLEAGGSFSPWFGSFGASIWMLDAKGAVVTTSDEIPLSSMHHAYGMSPERLPQITVTSPYYALNLSITDGNARELKIHPKPSSQRQFQMVFRSVGPAGGPIYKLERKGNDLLINDRWRVELPAHAQTSFIGSELQTHWDSLIDTVPQAVTTDRSGWGVARVNIPSDSITDIKIVDLKNVDVKAEPFPQNKFDLELKGFPDSFSGSIDAQIMALKMSMVGDETRPGDPNNYPLNWLRDGAYVIAALVRSGNTTMARSLANKFASLDFFGGFGAEGDGPGLSLWALGETSRSISDPEYERELWPHVVRKVDLIREMVAAEAAINKPYAGPTAPRVKRRNDSNLVAEKNRNGMINGRMDLHFPIFYVTAASYLGLREAQFIAQRLHKVEVMRAIERLADELQQSYRKSFVAPEFVDDVLNPRTAITGLWPAEIAEQSAFQKILEASYHANYGADGVPKTSQYWTYFNFGEAHQWLWLNKPERALAILDWFNNADPIPGLRIYWEGWGEENSFGLWKNVRGYVSPQNVTPHYWSAAESLLLSLDILAMGKRTDNTIVIGAGIPKDWLTRQLAVKNLTTPLGRVSWQWDGGHTVTITTNTTASIQLGQAFPRDTIVVRNAEEM